MKSGEYTGWYSLWNLVTTLGGTPYEIWWVHWVVLVWNLVSTLGGTCMKSGEYTGWYLYEIWWVHWVVLIWNLVSTLGGTYWWLVRVTLVVDWLFLPQNFGLVVGTYEGLLRLCECIWDGGSICRWWGHLTTIGANRNFFAACSGTLKPSIEYALLPLLPFTPLHSPFAPLCPSLLPLPPLLSFTPFTPFSHRGGGDPKPSIEYALLPFVPTEVVGTLKPSIQYACFPLSPQRWWGP